MRKHCRLLVGHPTGIEGDVQRLAVLLDGRLDHTRVRQLWIDSMLLGALQRHGLLSA